MKYLAMILIVGVLARHDTSHWLAEATGYSPQAIFYVLGGLWEVVLCSVILLLLTMAKKSVWAYLARAAMVIGIVEGLQIPVCRVLVYDIGKVPHGKNLCDYATGLPIGGAILGLYVLILIWGISAYRAA